jgi:hypothetical protein
MFIQFTIKSSWKYQSILNQYCHTKLQDLLQNPSKSLSNTQQLANQLYGGEKTIWGGPKVSTEIDNNFGYEKITQLVDNIPFKTMHSSILKHWGYVIKYPDFDYRHPALFSDDGVHLSLIGNDIFIDQIQSALETFRAFPWKNSRPN